MAFAHLHVHTEYSLLDGSNKIKEYVRRVKELGMDSAAITDHGVMYGVIDFYRAAKEAGIKPIIGCEVYVAPNSRFDRETGGGDDRYYHLVLLAENNTGYANLMKIVSRGFTEGFYYKPRVDMEVLEEYHEGIIALSACLAGEVARNIQKGLTDEAKKAEGAAKALFVSGGKTDDMPTTTVAKADMEAGKDILSLLVETKLAPTRSEARRLVQQGGVSVNDEKVADVYKTFTLADMDEEASLIIRKGKKVYHKVKAE